jgi:uncharacterized delta-60 repeat protein
MFVGFSDQCPDFTQNSVYIDGWKNLPAISCGETYFMKHIFIRLALPALVIGLFLTFTQSISAQSALDGFDPNANGTVYVVLVQPDGKILIGGGFTSVLGTARNNIARLNPNGTLDTGFNPNADNTVYSIAIQPDGKVLVGGNFNNIGGGPRNRIARLDASTGAADAWNPNADNTVYSVVIQTDGKVLTSGGFTSIGGQTRNNIARLDAATGAVDSFNPNANNTVYSIAVQSDGKIFAGGAFTTIGGQTRNYIARLTNTTPVLQSLIVNSNAIGWNRSGAGTQFTRVTYEQSIDNGANWTFLGNAAPGLTVPDGNVKGEAIEPSTFSVAAKGDIAPGIVQAAAYSLPGLSLPIGQNVLIRARGYYQSGYLSGSETTEELIKNVFFLAPTSANVFVSGKVLNGKSGIARATVAITGSSGTIRTVKTNSFGVFSIDNLEAGQTYIFSVTAKGSAFAPQVVTVNDNLTDLDFSALE